MRINSSQLILAAILGACSQNIGTNKTTASTQNSVAATTTSQSTNNPTLGMNELSVGVGDCGPNGYFNEPCVSVTICAPGTKNCQTIPNILLDTESYGLRIFSSLISVPLVQSKDSVGHSIAECAEFGVGADWGPVKMADVVLGSEPAVRIPIQVIDSTFPTLPTTCAQPDVNPQGAGFNGILGIGPRANDCGSYCVGVNPAPTYYACTQNSCAVTSLALSAQLTNPIVALPTDNNGLLLTIPSVPPTGAVSVTGTMFLGVGTQPNNTPGSVTVFMADSETNFMTSFNGKTYGPPNGAAYIDSGSNGIFFPLPVANSTTCSASDSSAGFLCPPSLSNYTATQISATGAAQKQISFSIVNAETAVAAGFRVFAAGVSTADPSSGPALSDAFGWGLPFFLGRSIYLGIEGKSSSLASGPYWAY